MTRLLVITKNGFFRNTGFDLSNHFEDNILIIEKFRQGKVYSVIYWDAEQKYYYVKRFILKSRKNLNVLLTKNPDLS